MASEAEQQIRRVTACGDDYYAILGLSRGVGEDEIKKAYRKLALRLHPDKCREAGAEEAFKRVAEAFSVLSDAEKRPVYDRYGAEGLRQGTGGGGGGGGGRGPGVFFQSSGRSGPPVDAFNIFEQFFGGRDPFAEMDEMFQGMHGGRPRGGSTPGGAGRPQGFGGGFGSMFQDDPFFSGGGMGMGGGSGFSSSMSTSFGGGGGTSFSSFSSSSMGGGGMMGSSSSTTTRVVNGKRVTVTEKTVRNADGTVETTRTESEGDGGGPQGMLGGDFFGGSPFGGSFFGGGGGRNRAATGPGHLGY